MEIEAPVRTARCEEKPFRFMDMPCEMRDEVYEHLLVDYPQIPATDKRLAMSVQQGPSQEMLFVGRQFSREYSETVTRTAKLLVSDKCAVIPNRICLQGGTLNNVTQAEMKIILNCCRCEDEQYDPAHKDCTLELILQEHCAWLAHVKDDFPHILSSKITVCLLNIPQPPAWPTGLPSFPALSARLATLTSAAVPGLKQITVFWGDENSGCRFAPDWHQVEVVGQYCQWTKEGGWTGA